MGELLIVKKCHVCCDKALFFHYNGLACASCKMFFRRNALRCEDLVCSYNGNCIVNKSYRRCCPKCRIDKCFEIGMKIELIESQKHSYNDTTTLCQIPKSGAQFEKSTMSERRNSESEASKFIENTIKNLYNEPVNSYQYNLLQNSVSKVPKSITRNCMKLNLTELKYIDELRATTNSIFDFDEKKLPVLYEETNSYAAINLSGSYVDRIVKYCKANAIFRLMAPAEQMLLLKQFTFDFVNIRYAYAYDCEKEAYLTIANEKGDSAVLTKVSLFQDFIHSNENETNKLLLSAEMDQDPIIRDLLTAQLFYNSTSTISNNLETMRYQYWTCHRLLWQYLSCKYKNMVKAKQKYGKLMKIVNELSDAKEDTRAKILKLEKESFKGVILEIFDIKADC